MDPCRGTQDVLNWHLQFNENIEPAEDPVPQVEDQENHLENQALAQPEVNAQVEQEAQPHAAINHAFVPIRLAQAPVNIPLPFHLEAREKAFILIRAIRVTFEVEIGEKAQTLINSEPASWIDAAAQLNAVANQHYSIFSNQLFVELHARINLKQEQLFGEPLLALPVIDNAAFLVQLHTPLEQNTLEAFKNYHRKLLGLLNEQLKVHSINFLNLLQPIINQNAVE